MDLPLIEKYRPKTFNDVVGNNDLEKIETLIKDPSTMPNLLFYGSAGLGKTSVAKIILKELNPIDFIKINGSDSTGVDVIRDRVYNFITSISTQPTKPKIVWIEEFDFLSANAYAALRSMIEQYMKNARFICTCNYINKIPEPIQSRFTTVEFVKSDDNKILQRMKKICEIEKIKVTDIILKEIITKSNGDMRTILNNIQQSSSNSEKTITEYNLNNISDLTNDVYKLLIEKNWSKIRYEIPEYHPDYEKMFVELENKFFESELPVSKKATITEIISNGLFEMSFSFKKDIAFSATCSKIIKIL